MTQVITSADFEEKVLKANTVVLVDFFADWCGPCKMLAPIIDEVSSEHGETYGIYKLDVDASGDIAQKYGVMSIPTMIFFKDGEEVERTMGVKEKDWIVTKLTDLSGVADGDVSSDSDGEE